MSRQAFVASTTGFRAPPGGLTPKERTVADFYAEHGEEAAFLSAAEIADRLGTSDATVVRAVKALGYSGIPELRRELIDDLRARATPAVRLERSLEGAGEDPLGNVIAAEVELLEDARRLDRGLFDRAVELLAGADCVLAFGLGPGGPLAEYFALRLRRYGRAARALTETGLLLADELLGLRPGDALLLMAYERLDHDAEVVLERAVEVGVPVVLLTDTLALGDRPGVTLAAFGAGRPLSGSGAVVAVLDALLLAIAAVDRDRSLGSLSELNELRARLRGLPILEQLR